MSTPKSGSKGWLACWNAFPLYIRIVIAMVVGLFTGLLLGERALFLEIPSKVILQLLGALAPHHQAAQEHGNHAWGAGGAGGAQTG